jgi:hypothetical protein
MTACIMPLPNRAPAEHAQIVRSASPPSARLTFLPSDQIEASCCQIVRLAERQIAEDFDGSPWSSPAPFGLAGALLPLGLEICRCAPVAASSRWTDCGSRHAPCCVYTPIARNLVLSLMARDPTSRPDRLRISRQPPGGQVSAGQRRMEQSLSERVGYLPPRSRRAERRVRPSCRPADPWRRNMALWRVRYAKCKMTSGSNSHFYTKPWR